MILIEGILSGDPANALQGFGSHQQTTDHDTGQGLCLIINGWHRLSTASAKCFFPSKPWTKRGRI